jgi:hypothetical protein
VTDYRHHILLPGYSAVYIDIAKVASSSIKRVLADLLELECPDGNPHEAAFTHPPAALRSQCAGAGFYSFAFVRNPWDRLVSCYRDKILGEVADFTRFGASGVARCLERFDAFRAGMTFAEFVRAIADIPDSAADEHFRAQADFLTDADKYLNVDFIGRFENLEMDFARLAARLNLPVRSLPRLQSATGTDYSGFYTSETRLLVAKRYAQDINLFDYEFGG